MSIDELEGRRATLSPAKQAALARLLRGGAAGKAAPRVDAIRRRPEGGPAPLTGAQQRLWFLDQLEPGSAAANLPVGIRLDGPLDVPLLERALRALLERHDALRIVFSLREGEPVQEPGAFPDPLLPVEEVDPSELRARVTAEANTPFQLLGGSVFRARLFRSAPEEHVLVLTVHHIVGDGWSTGVICRDLSLLYTAFARGEPAVLPELPIGYTDYAAWQVARAASPEVARQLDYWRRTLTGAPALLEIPTDRPRPAVRGSRGTARRWVLPKSLANALTARGREEGATLFMVLVAALAVVLRRWSGQEDLVLGTPLAGRTRQETEGLVGLFVQTLALRVDLTGDPTFRALVGRVRETTIAAFANQEVPFDRVVDELRVPRSLSHPPIFQTMVALHNVEADRSPHFEGLQAQLIGAELDAVEDDLRLFMNEHDGGLDVALHYSTELFDAATIDRLAAHFEAVLHGAVEDPDRPLSRFPLLAAGEREEVLERWNRSEAPYAPLPVHALVAERARHRPDAVALQAGDAALTYAELDARSTAIAAHLRGLGIGAGTLVALSMERTAALVPAILGVWKAGAAYVPVDPAYPAERRAYMVEDSGAAVVLADGASAPGVPAGAARVVVVDDLDLSAPAAASLPGVDPDALAYVIYTSGSTGRPKGVMVPHRGVANFLASMARAPGLGEEDVLVAVTSLSFDIAVLELFLPLSTGGRVVLAGGEESADPRRLAKLVERSGATAMQATPATWRMLVSAGWRGRPELVLLSGGEALPPELARELLARGRALWNLYGPTETTIWSAAHRVRAGEPISLGHPVANTRLYVVDPALEPAPLSVPGELLIGGAGVVRGYLGRPGLTAERFVPDPFGRESGARLYRTGDRVRRLPGGGLEFLGRIDFQVKVRGFRIELGEIEAALGDLPEVREAVVVVREEVAGDARIVAYLVPREGGELPAAERLRRALAGRLPEYMLPSAFVSLDALPLTPNGKVDRRALPAPEAPSREREPVAPRNPVEEIVAGFWREALRVEALGVEDDFFEIGGHSLLATRILVRIRESLGVDVPLRAFFETPTVAGLAEWVERGGTGRAAPPLRPRPAGTPPLPSHAQQRLWVLEQLNPGMATYNIPVALRLRGALDPDALRRTLSEVVRRHEGLRTRFPRVEGEPAAVVEPAAEVELPLTDLLHLPAGEREAEGVRVLESAARIPFDLETGPLHRAALARVGEEEHLLLFSVHHIVFDGWSTGILVREVAEIYTALAAGEPSPLPEPTIQYADFAAWERDWLTDEVVREQLAYWRGQLGAGSPVLELPSDRPRPARRSERGGTLPVRIPRELADGVARLSRSEGATPFMTLLAAYTALLHRYTGEEDISVGTPIANRPTAEAEGLMGFFVNTLALRADLSGAPTFRALLRQLREVALGAYAHQDLPFEQLVEELKPERDLSHLPLVQVAFALQNVPPSEARLGGLEISGVEATTATAKFDLHLSLQEDGAGLTGFLEYATDLFDVERMERFLRHFERLLASALAEPERRVDALPLLTEAERSEVARWSGRATTYPREASVVELFAETVAAHGARTALSWDGGEMTYAELDRRAERLTRVLRASGVGPDARVGVVAERSPALVVGIVAILKAGGAYVALDPAYPVERLAFMVSDTRMSVVIGAELLPFDLPPGVLGIGMEAGERGEAAAGEVSVPAPARGPESAAYVSYTSGSTGIPKGVVVPDRAVARLVRETDFASFGPEEVFLQYAPVAFDASTLELWGPLLNGGRLVVAPPGKLTPSEIAEQVERHGVSVLWLTSGLFTVMVEERLESLRGVRQLLAGGDVLSVDHVRRARAGLPETALINGYGPTENTTFTCCHRVEGEVEGPVPIGRPIANTRVYLLDGALSPVPVGVRGELCAGGDGVARGYLNRPALTAERFVPDPYGAPGSRLYRTGDLARYRADGAVEFVGRSDGQVKVRGFRIEVGEVESALCRHPGVREAVVVVREDRGGEKLLTGYVVGTEDGAPEEDALRAFLREGLPEHMVPGALVVVESLPLTANGKVDRRALPSPEREEEGRELVAPRDALELELVRIWEEVLGRGPIGVTDNFFELGGHSLRAVRLIDRVQAVTGQKLALATLFQDATIERMADQLRGRVEALPWSPVVGLKTRGTKAPLFCLHGGFGSVFCFAELARRVDPERPFYGLQPRGFFGGEAPLTRVEEMAAMHLEAIRKVQPEGPYHLAGYCMGGMVAMEIARILRDRGEEVALVAMLDTKGPMRGMRFLALEMDDDAFLVWFTAMIGREHTEASIRREMEEIAALPRQERLKLAMERAREAAALPPEIVELDAIPGWLRVYRANLGAVVAYEPARYDGPVSLLVAQDQPLPDPKLGWGDEADFELVPVPGNHESMLDAPHAEALGRALEARTADAARVPALASA